MATAPDLPDSVLLASFTGIKNTVAEERLQPSELAAAVNVDIDDVGQLRRRRGYQRRHSASHHSLTTLGARTFVVRDGVLGELSDDLAFRSIVPVGPGALCFERVGEVIYFSGEAVSGKIVNGEYQRWGQRGGAGVWVSPVERPTDTLGEIAGRLLRAPPYATALGLYKGRIYLAAGPLLWATELYNYELVDATRNFIALEDDITMIAPVADGLYIGTTAGLDFLQGTFTDGLRRQRIVSTPVIPGSLVWVPYSRVDPRARNGPMPEGEGPVFMTAGGVCLGLESGTVYNLTQDRTVFPAAVRAAALYREDQGANAYVAVTDSAGGPSANARIGDYVDAEIVRASQRG